MANDLSVLIPKIIAGIQAVLREAFILAQYVNKDFEATSLQVGNTVTVPIAASQSTYNVAPASTPPALTDTTPTSAQILVDQWKGTRFHLTSKEMREMDPGKFIPGQMAEAVRAIVFAINANLLDKYKKVYGFVGTPGTNPFATNSNLLADLHKVLSSQLAPMGDRRLVIGLDEEAAARKLTDFKDASLRGAPGVLANGEIGPAFGYSRIAADHQRPTHTAGTQTGAPTVSGAHAIGVTSILLATGAGEALALKQGDIITFSGGDTQTYVVGADLTVGASATGSVTISPALKVALSGGETITIKADHKVNLGFDPQAFGMVMRLPREEEIEGQIGRTAGLHVPVIDEQTGAVLMLSNFPGYHATQWELSALYGSELVVPERAARLAG